ncbi:MAG: hypothetical protein ABJA82_16730, partial [Myxococcales bacterium]
MPRRSVTSPIISPLSPLPAAGRWCSRPASKTLALALLATTTLIAAGCAGKGDIDRSQPDKLAKAFFVNADGTPKQFYYRWTVVDVPPTNGWAFEGMQ